MMPILPALAAAHLLVAVADRVPELNVVASCRAAATVGLGFQQSYEVCQRSEDTARDQLVKQWSEFLPADRTSCTNMTRVGTEGTYTELITCLEIKREVRKLRDAGATTAYGRVRP